MHRMSLGREGQRMGRDNWKSKYFNSLKRGKMVDGGRAKTRPGRYREGTVLTVLWIQLGDRW